MATPTVNKLHELELFRSIKRYDIDDLIEAASVSEDWYVISKEEKIEIKSQNSKRDSMREHFKKLIIENGRVTQLANFILRYNSPAQNAALAVLKVSHTVDTNRNQNSKRSSHSYDGSREKIGMENLSGGQSLKSESSPMEVETHKLSTVEQSTMGDSQARLTECSDSIDAGAKNSKENVIMPQSCPVPYGCCQNYSDCHVYEKQSQDSFSSADSTSPPISMDLDSKVLSLSLIHI